MWRPPVPQIESGAAGNSLDVRETNRDRGHFDWTDKSTSFF
jgi:hypothetical protein